MRLWQMYVVLVALAISLLAAAFIVAAVFPAPSCYACGAAALCGLEISQ